MSVTIPPLVTASQVLAALNLSAADQARVPATVVNASWLVRNFCGRFISRRPSADGTLGPIDVVLTPPLRGSIFLPEYPINDVFRVSGSKTTALSVQNNDQVNNQRALAKLVRTGGVIEGWTTTGLYLEWWSSGVQHTQTILFNTLATPTIGALAVAIQAVGSGWSAQAGDSDAASDNFTLWPVIELRSGQGAQGALYDVAEFEAWTNDLNHERDDEAGIITPDWNNDNPFSSSRWGPSGSLTFGDDQMKGGANGVRVVFDAGYDPIPGDLVDAVIEVVKAMLERKTASTTILKERTDSWMIEQREIFDVIPAAARQTLAMYRNNAQ